jgi:hypothetical protein
MLISGNHEVATQVLSEFFETSWAFFGAEDLRVFLRLYEELARIRNLSPVEKSTIEDVRDRVSPEFQSVSALALDAGLFCPGSWRAGP